MGMKVNGSTGLTFPDNTTMTTGAQAVKAWVNFNGTGTVAIRASFNVTSITDNATGDYTVNFTTAMTDANYSAVVQTGTGAPTGGGYGSIFAHSTPPTNSSVRLGCWGTGGSFIDFAYVNVAVFR